MIDGKKIVVVMPAYNAENTLARTYREIPLGPVDEVILVDDGSCDRTVMIAESLGIRHAVHPENLGYGGNQKTCFSMALEDQADIVVVLHPDYQYSPSLVSAMAQRVASGRCDIVLGSRIKDNGALQGGMPLYKYLGNRLLTGIQNRVFRLNLTDYHTGFRAYHARVLRELPLHENADGFLFDNQILVQAISFGFRIEEISCPARYLADSSSIGPLESMRYGFGVLNITARFLIHKKEVRESSSLSGWNNR